MSEPFRKLSLANTKVRELEARIAELEAELAECEFQASTKSDKDRILQLEAENERLDWMLDTLIEDFDCAEMVGAYTEDLDRRWAVYAGDSVLPPEQPAFGGRCRDGSHETVLPLAKRVEP